MFKPELNEQINQRLQQFFQVEVGNRVTVNNWSWLIASVKVIFDQNVVEPKKEGPPQE